MRSWYNELRIKGQSQIVVLNAPEKFQREFDALEGVTVHSNPSRLDRVGYVLAFVTNHEQITAVADAILPKAPGDPLVYFAYPKLASKRYRSEINRDSGWEPVLAAGFISGRQVALDEDWSLLRFRRSEHTSRVFDPSKITELRILRGWNQRELAERAGVAQPWLSKLENKRIESPDMYRMQKIADAFETPVTTFLIYKGRVHEGSEQASLDIENQDRARVTDLKPRLRVFICHASSDKPAARELYQWLITEGFEPWLDEEDLLPGQNWKKEIPRAVSATHVVVVCLSKTATTKQGFVQKEIGYALDVASEQPEDTIFIIPVRLEECVVPDRLSEWQWVNLHEQRGHERLLRALRHRAESLQSI